MVEVSYYFLLHISNSTEQSREGRKFYFTQFSIHLIHHFQIAENASCCLLKILHKLLMFSIHEIGYAKVQGNTRWCFFVCKLMQSATQLFLVSLRNVCGEECCVTMLKTAVQQTKTDDCFNVFEKSVTSFMSQTWAKKKRASPQWDGNL